MSNTEIKMTTESLVNAIVAAFKYPDQLTFVKIGDSIEFGWRGTMFELKRMDEADIYVWEIESEYSKSGSSFAIFVGHAVRKELVKAGILVEGWECL